ncbi:MAG TPA: membrane dipeptidase [Gemmatimonadaceae bacterium]
MSGARAASDVLTSHLVWDNHVCMPLRPHDQSRVPELDRWKRVGVDVVMLNIGFGEMGVEEHVRNVASFRSWISAHSDEYVLIDTVGDVELARATGRMAIGFDIEGANAIGDQLSLIQLYYGLGVRWMLLAYNRNNRVGGGCQDDDTGLTAFGREVIAEMERVGMMVCCSHTGERTTLETMEIATKPVILSHSNPRALRDHPRNVSDEVLRACARTGGVVGLNGIGIFLGDNDISTETFVGHIDYVVSLIGASHVGLGIDYPVDQKEVEDHIAKMRATFPSGLGYDLKVKVMPPEQLPDIVERLLQLGYSSSDLAGILGGNWMRAARACWQGGEW